MPFHESCRTALIHARRIETAPALDPLDAAAVLIDAAAWVKARTWWCCAFQSQYRHPACEEGIAQVTYLCTVARYYLDCAQGQLFDAQPPNVLRSG